MKITRNKYEKARDRIPKLNLELKNCQEMVGAFERGMAAAGKLGNQLDAVTVDGEGILSFECRPVGKTEAGELEE